ncbi:MAG: sigma-70 family RNA polymerase sigma factor [Acidobacteria bacterium]|nr:sigma-70 family RNA polymerase sigma factor [Acidobacteriota bacterium]MCI0659797.1 sigma-70 family RNA polymerase sigma factor [Acidobacteriota bacterium]
MRLARDGDESAFEEIVRRYTPRVFQIASRFFRQRNQVEESAQEIFIRVYTRLADYEGRGSFGGWLTRIATTTCINLIRYNKRRPEITLTDLTTEENEWLEDRLASIAVEPRKSIEDTLIAADLAEKVLKTLSPEDRLVLILIDGDEFSVKEVSEMTGWSEGKVKVRAFRARRRMREAVEKLLAGTTRKPV